MNGLIPRQCFVERLTDPADASGANKDSVPKFPLGDRDERRCEVVCNLNKRRWQRRCVIGAAALPRSMDNWNDSLADRLALTLYSSDDVLRQLSGSRWDVERVVAEGKIDRQLSCNTNKHLFRPTGVILAEFFVVARIEHDQALVF